MEEIDLVGGESRALEMTGRTKMIGSNILFSVEEVYEKNNG